MHIAPWRACPASPWVQTDQERCCPEVAKPPPHFCSPRADSRTFYLFQWIMFSIFQFTFLFVPLFQRAVFQNAFPLEQPSCNLFPSWACLQHTSSWVCVHACTCARAWCRAGISDLFSPQSNLFVTLPENFTSIPGIFTWMSVVQRTPSRVPTL